ncbi:hypothetical protein RIF29_00127 [Crotalaria pallida]|uniref:DUF7356 domain-containing protein n=1 Tax=Crotalaria pallida TaxID=3830 RepID=A0AAN9IVH6_CROPI
MGRLPQKLILLLFLLLLFFFHSSSSSSSHRKQLLTSQQDHSIDNNKTTETPPAPPHDDSPPPSPQLNKKKPDPIPNPPVAGDGETKNNKEGPKEGATTNVKNNSTVSPDSTPSVPKVVNEKEKKKEKEKANKDTAPPANDAPPPPANNAPPPPANAPPPVVPAKSGEQEKKEKKKEGDSGSKPITNESCDGLNKCKDDGDMVACISFIDPKYLVVLIQNNGDGTIKVKPLVESYRQYIEVGKHQTEKINISLISSEITQLTLTAGKGDCVLHMDTVVPKENFFLRLPSFDKLLTPVNGAYFLIFAVLVFGGTWGCCRLRKKRQDEIPYQELEMALPESVSATNVESAEGWDQDWDDDWDDNVAVKSPAAHRVGSISANGLTSRSANKDGWENSWDD